MLEMRPATNPNTKLNCQMLETLKTINKDPRFVEEMNVARHLSG